MSDYSITSDWTFWDFYVEDGWDRENEYGAESAAELSVEIHDHGFWRRNDTRDAVKISKNKSEQWISGRYF